MEQKHVFKFFSTRLARRICRSIGGISEKPVPRSLMTPAMHLYALGFGVDMNEAQIPSDGFRCFGDFFARPLKQGARSICGEPDALISPCDGALVDVHRFDDNHNGQVFVKGYHYSVEKLTGDTAPDRFSGGDGLVFYLHPRDYHRVHAPLSARLTSVRHIPGHRYPVASWSERNVPGIYEKNERTVFNFEIGNHHLCLIMVAAFGVGHIDTPFGPPLSRDMITSRSFDIPPAVTRAEELGAFRLGSTVVILASCGLLTGLDADSQGRVRMGQKIGRVQTGAEEKQ